MNKIVHFAKEHPYQVALMAGVAVLAVFYFMNTGKQQQGDGGAGAALQNAYFQAEAIQAQAGSNIQVANIMANRDTSIAQISAAAKGASDTTWANSALAITQSNNQAQTAALPYATESQLIGALAGVSSQTQTTSSHSSGFFGIGGGSKTTTTSTPAAMSAANYLAELGNGLFSMH